MFYSAVIIPFLADSAVIIPFLAIVLTNILYNNIIKIQYNKIIKSLDYLLNDFTFKIFLLFDGHRETLNSWRAILTHVPIFSFLLQGY